MQSRPRVVEPRAVSWSAGRGFDADPGHRPLERSPGRRPAGASSLRPCSAS